MKALVVGRDGMLGSAICEILRASGYEFEATTRHLNETPYLDLLTPERFKMGELVAFDVIFLVAAITKVVDCEAEPARTWRVNADAPVYLANKAMRLRSAHPVFISSDAVERAPGLNYSRQKAYVESFILARGGTVVRPSRIPPERVVELADKIVRLGMDNAVGLVRWDGSQ